MPGPGDTHACSAHATRRFDTRCLRRCCRLGAACAGRCQRGGITQGRRGALGARVEQRALALNLGHVVARELRRAEKACHVLAARGALQIGIVLALILRIEMYGPEDPANSPDHDTNVAKQPFSIMPRRAVYFQRYRNGRNWGLCIRGEGQTNFLVRAVEIEGRGELGMTRFAEYVANRLGATNLVHKSPPCRATEWASGSPALGPKKKASFGRPLRAHPCVFLRCR